MSDMEGPAVESERSGLFLDTANMKERIRKQMAKPEYDVTDFYKKTGFAQHVARHPWFEKVTLFVVALNAIWIAIDTDYNKQCMLINADAVFQIVEHLFCIYFTFEWTMRFTAFAEKRNCRKDFWFAFDSLLVSTMVAETWVITAFMAFSSTTSSDSLGNASILRMARLLKLVRMARMARFLRAMPELLILIKGMAAALRSVMFTLSLLTVIMYVFAIAFTQLCDGEDCAAEFSSVIDSMHYLLVKGALMDGVGDVTKLLKQQNFVLLMVFYVYVLLAALTVMNMLIGVICEVVSAVAATEQEASKMNYVKEKIEQLIRNSDNDFDGRISKEEFLALFENAKAMAILSDVGVDVVGLPDLVPAIFEEDSGEKLGEKKTLSFEDFMSVILDLRGTNGATVRDIVDLRKYINSRISTFEKKVMDLESFTHGFSRESNFLRTVSSASLPVNVSIADLPGNVSSACLPEPVRSWEDAPRLQQLIDESLKDLFDLQQGEVSRLLEDNCRLQAELNAFQGKQVELSKFANLEQMQSVAQADCEAAVAIKGDDAHFASLAVLSSEVTLKRQVSFTHYMDSTALPDGLGCMNQAATLLTSTALACSSGWGTPAQQFVRKQSSEGAALKLSPLDSSIFAAPRSNRRVQQCGCLLLQQPLDAPWSSVD